MKEGLCAVKSSFNWIVTAKSCKAFTSHTHTRGSGKVEQWPKHTQGQTDRESLWSRAIECEGVGLGAMREVVKWVTDDDVTYWYRLSLVRWLCVRTIMILRKRNVKKKKKNPPTHILWSPKTDALRALLNLSDGHVDTHVFVSLSVPTLCCLFVFRHVCLHWLHNIFRHQKRCRGSSICASVRPVHIHVTCHPQPTSDHHGNGAAALGEISPNPFWPSAITE